MATQLRTVRVGDVFQILFPNTVHKSYLCMVTGAHDYGVWVANIAVSGEGPVSGALRQVTQAMLDLPQLRQGRIILRHKPEYRFWQEKPNALMCFGVNQPELPVGLALDELVRHNDGQFVLGRDQSRYVNPFYDYVKGAVRRQFVTVFQLDNGAEIDCSTCEHKYGMFGCRVPAGATFTRIGEGPVLSSTADSLWIGTGSHAAADLYSLYSNYVFAIESRLLKPAQPDAS